MTAASRPLAFLGTPAFAVPALRALHATGRPIAAVYCQPPRPAGRGQAVVRCAVHVEADRLGLPVRHPERLRDEAGAFAALGLHTAVVAAYGLILPRAMLAAPANGCLNIHASLLPRWRGASPIQSALLAGDAETGVTIMRMEAGLDTGPMLAATRIPIHPRMTAPELHDALAALGADLIVPALDDPSPGTPQPEEGATYAAKLTREDGRIDWTRNAAAIDRQVRALNPWPGTYTTLEGAMLKVLAAEPEMGSAAPGAGLAGVAPGTTIDDALTIATGAGTIRVTRVQAPGRAALPAADFLRGRPVSAGTRLGEAAR